MIVLDTNVISELWKAAPDPNVLAWQRCPQASGARFISSGWKGKYCRAFKSRVLPFDLDTSQTYADLMAQAKTVGKTIGSADGYIAATAATRDTIPFKAAGLSTINPWKMQVDSP